MRWYGDIPLHPFAGAVHEVQLEVSGGFDSDALHNDLVLGLIQGKTLDRGMREASAADLSPLNRFMQTALVRATYIGLDSLWGHPRWRPMWSVSHQDVFGIRFTEDAYRLAFFGNKAYEGTTATLDGSAHERQRFQTAGFGIQDARTGSFLQLEVVNGQYLNASDLQEASLHTAAQGIELDARVNGTYWRNDTAGSAAFGRSNGLGLAVSGRWIKPFSFHEKPGWLILRAEDIGFVRWRRASTIVRDSTIAYEGIEVDNIFDAGDLDLTENDLLDTLGLRYEQGAVLRPTPFLASMTITTRLSEVWYASVRLDQRNLPGYRPRASMQFARDLDPVVLSTQLAFGGPGGVRFGVDAFLAIGPHLTLQAGTTNLIGTVSREAKGMSGRFGSVFVW